MIASLTLNRHLGISIAAAIALACVSTAVHAQIAPESGYCCMPSQHGCVPSTNDTCVGVGAYFEPGTETNCESVCRGTCGDGFADPGECGDGGTCPQDCEDYKACIDYEDQAECLDKSGCDWYDDIYNWGMPPFCEHELYFCGDYACESGFGEDDSNCPRDCDVRCGNGTVEGDEECDDSNQVDGDGCSATCKEEYCGNGVEDFGEECDPGTGGGIDEYEAADDSADCNYDCTIPYCGDSYVNPKEVNDDGSPVEQCDDGNYDNGDGCAYDCTLEECGNGVQDEYEDCDDGNLDDGDGCSQYCTIEACGNGVIDYGEDCDPDTGTYFYDGIWADYASADCDDDCTLPECGDGILNDLAENTAASGTEQCDDGNFDEGDGCSPYCTLEECGNGETDPPWEDCDDGNLTDGDGCSQFCEIEACGNGEIDYGEECDPDTGTTADSYVAAANSADCTLNCTYSFCGDDVVNNEADEECDPDMGESDSPVMSNDDSADCTMFCTASFCGDGWTNYAANEECDPGLTCDDGSDCTYSGVCDDGSSCALRGDSYCDFNCTYAPDVTGLCCFDYDYENDVYLYTASAGQTSSDCTDNDGRFEASSEDAATPGEQDALCGWTGACCELGDTGEVIDAYASTYADCFGEYKTAAEADEDRDGHVSHEEAQKVCDFVQEYVCLDEGGGFTERTDGGAVQDADGYVEGGKYIFRTTGHPYCRTVWRMSDCSPAAYADVAAAGEAFATDQQYCSSI